MEPSSTSVCLCVCLCMHVCLSVYQSVASHISETSVAIVKFDTVAASVCITIQLLVAFILIYGYTSMSRKTLVSACFPIAFSVSVQRSQ